MLGRLLALLLALLGIIAVAGCSTIPATATSSTEVPWVLWSMSQGTTLNQRTGNPYFWTPDGDARPRAECERLVKERTGRRLITPIAWYTEPDNPRKWWGCLPAGYDPEEAPK